MAEINTNWCQSVGGVVLRDGRVLLARHTYGAGKGCLIIPGGYVQMGESPEDALRREVYEETGVRVEPRGILGGMWFSRRTMRRATRAPIRMKTIWWRGCLWRRR